MKLINQLETMFKRMMGNTIFYKDSTVKEVISEIIQQDVDTLSSHEEVYILLKAMINAAKSDGHIDPKEQHKIMEFLGDMSKMDQLFVEQEMKKELNLEEFIQEVPKKMAQQVYYMSLFAIDLDVESERAYLKQLARGLSLSSNITDQIHENLDVGVLA